MKNDPTDRYYLWGKNDGQLNLIERIVNNWDTGYKLEDIKNKVLLRSKLLKLTDDICD